VLRSAASLHLISVWTASHRGFLRWMGGVAAAACLVAFSYGIVTSRSIRIEQRIVPCRGLSTACDGLTILQISDLHSGRNLNLNRQAADILQSLAGDLLVITGDFGRGGAGIKEAVEGARIVVSAVRQRMPVYAVQGNSDYPVTMRSIEKLGITVLDNKAVRIRPQLWLVGWNPYLRGHPRLETVLRAIPPSDAIVLASHSPDIIREPRSSRASLIMSGHTHGGQVRIPGCRPLFLLTHISSRYYAGLYDLGDHYLNINRGIGTSMIPLRMFSPPEITSLTLRSTQ
jgi:predicted MPP superfamily phosphohydrolase